MYDLGVGLTLLAGLGVATAESGLGVGTVLPGETVVVVLAASMPSWPWTLALGICVAAGASLGDHVGYLVGRRFGHRLRETRLVRRLGTGSYDRAVDTLHRRGAAAVFLTRLVPVVRVLTPAAAGVAKVPYRSFLPASLAGSVLWSAVYVGGGSALAAVLAPAAGALGAAALPVGLGVLGAIGLGVLMWRARRARRREGAAAAPAALPARSATAVRVPTTTAA